MVECLCGKANELAKELRKRAKRGGSKDSDRNKYRTWKETPALRLSSFSFSSLYFPLRLFYFPPRIWMCFLVRLCDFIQ